MSQAPLLPPPLRPDRSGVPSAGWLIGTFSVAFCVAVVVLGPLYGGRGSVAPSPAAPSPSPPPALVTVTITPTDLKDRAVAKAYQQTHIQVMDPSGAVHVGPQPDHSGKWTVEKLQANDRVCLVPPQNGKPIEPQEVWKPTTSRSGQSLFCAVTTAGPLTFTVNQGS